MLYVSKKQLFHGNISTNPKKKGLLHDGSLPVEIRLAPVQLSKGSEAMSTSLVTSDRDRAYQVVYLIDSCHHGNGVEGYCLLLFLYWDFKLPSY